MGCQRRPMISPIAKLARATSIGTRRSRSGSTRGEFNNQDLAAPTAGMRSATLRRAEVQKTVSSVSWLRAAGNVNPWLALENHDGLDVKGLREEVNEVQRADPVVRLQHGQVPSQRRWIA